MARTPEQKAAAAKRAREYRARLAETSPVVRQESSDCPGCERLADLLDRAMAHLASVTRVTLETVTRDARVTSHAVTQSDDSALTHPVAGPPRAGAGARPVSRISSSLLTNIQDPAALGPSEKDSSGVDGGHADGVTERDAETVTRDVTRDVTPSVMRALPPPLSEDRHRAKAAADLKKLGELEKSWGKGGGR